MNDGAYQAFLNHIYEPEQLQKLKPFIAEGDITKRPKKLSTIWGQTSTLKDYILKNVMFHEVEIGEHFIIKQYGAYTQSFRTDHNGFPKPNIKYIISDENRKYLEM